MARANVRRRHSDLPHFESVARISNLPIVESGMYIAGNVYRKIKVLCVTDGREFIVYSFIASLDESCDSN